ncbi:MAG: Fe-S cluster assembly protein SufD [Flavobacteriales bacterium]
MTKDAFLKQFDSKPALFPIQGQARAAIRNGLAFPTTRDEKWKYTRVSSLVSADYGHAEGRLETIEQFRIQGADYATLVFINGRFHADLSDAVPEGMIAVSMASSFGTQRNQMLDKLGKQGDIEEQAFVSLNTAFFEDGAYIKVVANTRIEKPVCILNIAQGTKQASNVRNLIHIERGAEISLLHQFEGDQNDGSFSNAVTEIFVDENAKATYYLIENEGPSASGINATYVEQKRDSHYTQVTVTKSGKLVRNNIHASITGEGCETNMMGIYFTSDRQHVDNQTYADHQKPNCNSNELYKGVMTDRSTGVFNGKIMVHQDAQKTNAFQSNQNILLSDAATINTKPELEIYADDVKCSHGCTVGQLDEEAMFYLRSRGLGKEAAHRLLVQAFAADVIEVIEHAAIREDIARFIESKFQ